MAPAEDVHVTRPTLLPDTNGLRVRFCALSCAAVRLTVDLHRRETMVVVAQPTSIGCAVFPGARLEHVSMCSTSWAFHSSASSLLACCFARCCLSSASSSCGSTLRNGQKSFGVGKHLMLAVLEVLVRRLGESMDDPRGFALRSLFIDFFGGHLACCLAVRLRAERRVKREYGRRMKLGSEEGVHLARSCAATSWLTTASDSDSLSVTQ